MGDWDGDGDWDMALGAIQGPVKLYRNNGDMTFEDAGPFKVNGRDVTANDGGPCIVDWDGDGVLDLLLGDGEGNVQFLQGTAKGSRDLKGDDDSLLLPKADLQKSWEPRKKNNSKAGFDASRPGVRTKPFAADWNGDGKLDLLVGDFLNIESTPKKLDAAQKKELARLDKKQAHISQKLGAVYQRAEKAAMKTAGISSTTNMSKEQMDKYGKAWQVAIEKDKEYQALNKENQAVYTKIQTLRPAPEYTGVVWVYLRK